MWRSRHWDFWASPPESIIKVLRGWRNWNCVFNQERKSLVAWLSPLRSEGKGWPELFYVRFELHKPWKLPWIHLWWPPLRACISKTTSRLSTWAICLVLALRQSPSKEGTKRGQVHLQIPCDLTGKSSPECGEPEGSLRQNVTRGLFKISGFFHFSIYIPKRIQGHSRSKFKFSWRRE